MIWANHITCFVFCLRNLLRTYIYVLSFLATFQSFITFSNWLINWWLLAHITPLSLAVTVSQSVNPQVFSFVKYGEYLSTCWKFWSWSETQHLKKFQPLVRLNYQWCNKCCLLILLVTHVIFCDVRMKQPNFINNFFC